MDQSCKSSTLWFSEPNVNFELFFTCEPSKVNSIQLFVLLIKEKTVYRNDFNENFSITKHSQISTSFRIESIDTKRFVPSLSDFASNLAKCKLLCKGFGKGCHRTENCRSIIRIQIEWLQI